MTLGRAASLSLALHALALLLLVAGGLLRPARLPPPKALAEVELVEQNTPTVGAARRAAPPTRPAPAKPPPMRRARAAPLPLPAPRPPALPRAAPAAAGGAGSAGGAAGTGLVSGSQIVPAALNRAARNIPPAYPPAAVRAGEQGSVILEIRVAPDGTGAVAIARSSGYTVLDDAARIAVARWHFIPALSGGRPVSSAMLIRIRFILTQAEGGPEGAQ